MTVPIGIKLSGLGYSWIVMRALKVASRWIKYRKAEIIGFPESLSTKSQYGIRSNYRHRIDNAFFDDTPFKDEYQKEVYERAAQIAKDMPARNVADVGCGSAYKLITNFPDTPTVGYDLDPTVEYLRKTYPDRAWKSSDFNDDVEPVDLVICADVIEHIPNPDLLMGFLARLTRRCLVLSTPERKAFYGWDHSGPPRNPAHCREWVMGELVAYASRWFCVDEARITHRRHGTQTLVCSPKG